MTVRGAVRDSGRTLVQRLPAVSLWSSHLDEPDFLDPDELSGDHVAWGLADQPRAGNAGHWGRRRHQRGLSDWLGLQRFDRTDLPVRLGMRRRSDCRLVALRLPGEAAQRRVLELKREMSKKGPKASGRQRMLRRSVVLITDLAAD